MDEQATSNLNWSMALINELVCLGVQRVVISPGSRSTPLTLAALRHPGLRHWIMVDERSAAFFALGLSKADRHPTVLIATSGSAPANWHPAVIEAYYAQIPLILLSADRPAELQNCGANQTINQFRLFGTQVQHFAQISPDDDDEGVTAASLRRVVGHCLAPIPGPVHINIPLREPLLPREAVLPPPVPHDSALPPPPASPPPAQAIKALSAKLRDGKGLIVCGWGHYGANFPKAVSRLARHLNAPLLADPLANLRYHADSGPAASSRYDGFLRSKQFTRTHPPDWVLRFGAMPVSTPLQHYLAALSTPIFIQVDPLGQFLDPLRRDSDTLHCDPGLFCETLIGQMAAIGPSAWGDDFSAAEARTAETALALDTFFEGTLIQQLIPRLPAESVIFSGNSMPIRDLDAFMGSGNRLLTVYANRGASGIDGNLSTFLGMAAAYRGAGKMVALVGDLTFFHDMNALIAARDCNATIILLNNGGGGIFSYLPPAGLAEFERAWLTPTAIDFSQAARLYGLPHRRADTTQGLDAAMEWAFSHSGVTLIEVMLEREQSVQCHHQYWQTLSSGCPGA